MIASQIHFEISFAESGQNNVHASYADVVKHGGVTRQVEDQEGQDIAQDQDKQGIVPTTESIQSHGLSKSDSSVEVIPDVTKVWSIDNVL